MPADFLVIMAFHYLSAWIAVHSPAEPYQTAVIVLGMHRSGTSCLTGCLQQLGLFLGDVFEWNRGNQKGNRENKNIMRLNNSILEYSGGSWDNIPERISWNYQHLAYRERIISSFQSTNHRLWGFKDPRMLLTYPFWTEALQRYSFVGTFRHPQAVADSLHHRNNTVSVATGLGLWYIYNSILAGLLEQHKFPLVSFDATKDEYYASLVKVANYLAMKEPVTNVDFFDRNLVHEHRIYPDTALPDHILNTYRILKKYYLEQGSFSGRGD